MQTNSTLSAWDYVVLVLVLVLPTCIGIYYGCSGGRQRTTSEYLMADRNMPTMPVSLSLLSSFMSAIFLLGIPSEIYVYGTQYCMIGVGFTLTIVLATPIFLPVFYKLRLTSVFEYLELRFSRGVRLCGAVVWIIQMLLYLSVVLYAPALALNAVTGFNIWISVLSVGLVCTFYTTLGGMKAVIWTDVFQCFIMFTGLIAILVKGYLEFGGFSQIWTYVEQGQRIEFFNFDPNPTTRCTFWTMSLGITFMWLAIYGVNQAQVQRALTTPTLRQAQIAMWCNVPGLITLLVLCTMCGMICYAHYRDCDPLISKRILAPDQLLPLYVMDTMRDWKGLPGLFTAAIFSSTLSTISSVLNSLAAVTVQDIVRGCFCPNMSDTKASTVSKVLACSYGCLCIVLTVIPSQLGQVLEIAFILFGGLGGPLVSLYALGILYPCANKYGAYAGFFSSLLLMAWIGTGANMYKAQIWKPPVSIEGCPKDILDLSDVRVYDNDSTSLMTMNLVDRTTPQMALNNTGINNTLETGTEWSLNKGLLDFYHISYMWYSVMALIVCTVVGLTVSVCTGGTRHQNLDPTLTLPVCDIIREWLPEKWLLWLRCEGQKNTHQVKEPDSNMECKEEPLLAGVLNYKDTVI